VPKPASVAGMELEAVHQPASELAIDGRELPAHPLHEVGMLLQVVVRLAPGLGQDALPLGLGVRAHPAGAPLGFP
jgi:hypothetical protein